MSAKPKSNLWKRQGCMHKTTFEHWRHDETWWDVTWRDMTWHDCLDVTQIPKWQSVYSLNLVDAGCFLSVLLYTTQMSATLCTRCIAGLWRWKLCCIWAASLWSTSELLGAPLWGAKVRLHEIHTRVLIHINTPLCVGLKGNPCELR